MYELSIIEVVLFFSLFTFERVLPARQFPISQKWFAHWCYLMLFASSWLVGLLMIWPHIPELFQPVAEWPFWAQLITIYFAYSFFGYWYHRIRHSNKVLWHYIHYMHHSPAHMDTRVTFWRHPLEMILDSLVIVAVGKMMGATVELILGVLILESMLEIFHHSNIHTPLKLRWIGYFLQLPEQHLIHHQRRVHCWNYGTVTFWDTLFGTVRVPREWNGDVGLPQWNETQKLLMFKY